MNERYTIAITPNPDAGSDMISILIIDTMPEDGRSEIYSATVPRSEKYTAIFPYLGKVGHDMHIVDLTI